MLDLALLVERNGREDAVLITPTKVRDYQDFETFGALWTFEHVPGTKQLHTGRFWAKSTANPEELVNLAISQHIKNELRGNGWMTAKGVPQLVRDRIGSATGRKPAGTNKIYGLIPRDGRGRKTYEAGKSKELGVSSRMISSQILTAHDGQFFVTGRGRDNALCHGGGRDKI